MNISEAAEFSSLPAKTIRYYETIGLIRPLRGENGYRVFQQNDLHKLVFMHRARELGFTIADCRVLLALYNDPGRESAEVKQVALEHLGHVAEKIRLLEGLQATLRELVEACAGDHRPDCPILKDLATGTAILSAAAPVEVFS